MQETQEDKVMRLCDVPPGCLVQIRIDTEQGRGRGFAWVQTKRVMFIGIDAASQWAEGLSAPRPMQPHAPSSELEAHILLNNVPEDAALVELQERAADAVLRRMIVARENDDEAVFLSVRGVLLNIDATRENWQSKVDELLAWLKERGLSATATDMQALTLLANEGRTRAEAGRFTFWRAVPPGTLVRTRDNRYIRDARTDDNMGTHGAQVCFDGAWLDPGAESPARPWDGFGIDDVVEIVATDINVAAMTTADLKLCDALHYIGQRIKWLHEEWPVLQTLVEKHSQTPGCTPSSVLNELVAVCAGAGMEPRDVTPTKLLPHLLPWITDSDHISTLNRALMDLDAALFEARRVSTAAQAVLREVSGRIDVEPAVGLRQLHHTLRER